MTCCGAGAREGEGEPLNPVTMTQPACKNNAAAESRVFSGAGGRTGRESAVTSEKTVRPEIRHIPVSAATGLRFSSRALSSPPARKDLS